jgi:hypothetical protein
MIEWNRGGRLVATIGEFPPFVVVELLVEHLYFAEAQLVDGLGAILEVDTLRLLSLWDSS